MRIWMFNCTSYFEGVNSLKNIDDFGELYEPQAVNFTFDTIGWKLLVLFLVISIVITLIIKIRRYHQNRYRRQALNTIKQLPSEEQTIYYLFIILKKTAINVFGRKIVGPMFGREWLVFLDKTGKDVRFMKYEKTILKSIYEGRNPETEVVNEIIGNAQKWIKTHAV